MVEAGDSADHAQAMYDQSVTTVVIVAVIVAAAQRRPRDHPRADARPTLAEVGARPRIAEAIRRRVPRGPEES
jgi:hypothetical protein